MSPSERIKEMDEFARDLMPECPMEKKDCAACNGEGRCRALDRTDFRGKPCPFYKSAEQQTAENDSVWDRLVKLGRYDLVSKYHSEELQKKEKEKK